MRRYGLKPCDMEDLTPGEWQQILLDFQQQNP
jgi:hypothetical protein